MITRSDYPKAYTNNHIRSIYTLTSSVSNTWNEAHVLGIIWAETSPFFFFHLGCFSIFHVLQAALSAELKIPNYEQFLEFATLNLPIGTYFDWRQYSTHIHNNRECTRPMQGIHRWEGICRILCSIICMYSLWLNLFCFRFL